MSPPDGDYLDFEVSIDARGDGMYEVAARSPTGDGRTTVAMAFDVAEAHHTVAGAHRSWRAEAPVLRDVGRHGPQPGGEQALRALGAKLFDTVMSGKVGQRYRSSYDRALSTNQGLRLRLRIQAPEIAALPWEYLYDTGHEHFVARTNLTSVVRYVEVDQPSASLHVDFPLRVLGVIASPTDHAALQKDLEARRMEEALRDLCERGFVQLVWADAGTYEGLSDALVAHRPQVLHFIGHGGFDEAQGEGTILLERNDGSAHPLPSAALGDLLLGGGTVRLVVLNSCEGARSSGGNLFSSTAATLVRRGVPAVIAMQYPVTDHAAIRFSHELYEGLADSRPVDRAVSSARLHLHADEPRSPEWGTPVLFLQSDTGLLFSTSMHRSREAPPRSSPPRAPGRHWAWAALGAATGGLALGAGLGLSPAPTVEVVADIVTRDAAFRLDTAATLGQAVSLDSLTVPAHRVIELPVPGKPRRLLTDLVSLTAVGTLRLELSEVVLARGTLVTLSASGAPGDYRLEMTGAVPPVGVTVDGRLATRIDGTTEVHDFPRADRMRLVASSGDDDTLATVALGLGVGASDSLRFDGPLAVRSLRFHRIEHDLGDGAPTRSVPGIQSGTVQFDGGGRLAIDPRRDLRFRVVRGAVDRVTLARGLIAVRFRGTVDSLGIGAQRSPTLMPSRLEVLSLPHRVAALLGAAAVGALLMLAALRLVRRAPIAP